MPAMKMISCGPQGWGSYNQLWFVGGRWAPGSELRCSFGWTLFLTRRPVQKQNKCLPSIWGFKDHVSTVPHHYEHVSLNLEGT